MNQPARERMNEQSYARVYLVYMFGELSSKSKLAKMKSSPITRFYVFSWWMQLLLGYLSFSLAVIFYAFIEEKFMLSCVVSTMINGP